MNKLEGSGFSGNRNRKWAIARAAPNWLAIVAAFAFVFWIVWGSDGGRDRLVVYCAHDSVYSKEILDRFAAESGIAVEVKFDTEAT